MLESSWELLALMNLNHHGVTSACHISSRLYKQYYCSVPLQRPIGWQQYMQPVPTKGEPVSAQTWEIDWGTKPIKTCQAGELHPAPGTVHAAAMLALQVHHVLCQLSDIFIAI